MFIQSADFGKDFSDVLGEDVDRVHDLVSSLWDILDWKDEFNNTEWVTSSTPLLYSLDDLDTNLGGIIRGKTTFLGLNGKAHKDYVRVLTVSINEIESYISEYKSELRHELGSSNFSFVRKTVNKILGIVRDIRDFLEDNL